MKYWAYLNDGVSQKPYTEEELQQLDGFGPDILICSETSAVSQEPDWKPVRELLPHLIRPKAPDFSKFRPKPPVSAAHNDSNVLPVPEVLPTGVKAVPVDSQQVNQSPAQDVNSELLAQIKSLTDKIASLEGKISEQEKEISNANLPEPEQEVEGLGETFVSEPQNEQEDDVLEVPFENDFEVPFDANKSSEEIAKEAEAMLSKPVASEIEEYNTDDQNTEMMDYESDMQKILEDTIRRNHSRKSTTDANKKDKKAKVRTFIAEDLISNQTLSFSEKEEPEKEEQKHNDQEQPSQEEEETSEPKNTSFDVQEQNATDENQTDKQEPVDENAEQSLEEILQKYTEPENSAQDEEQTSTTDDNVPAVKAEESVQAEQEEVPVEKEEAPSEAQLSSLEAVSEVKTEEPAQAEQEEVHTEPQLVSLEAVPGVETEEPAQAEQEKVHTEPQLVSLEAVPGVETEEPTQAEQEEVHTEPQFASLNAVAESTDENSIQIEQNQEQDEPNLVSEDLTGESGEIALEELSSNDSEVEKSIDFNDNDEYLKTVSLDTVDMDVPADVTQQLNISEAPIEEQKEDVPQEEPLQEEDLEADIPEISPDENQVEISSQVNEENPVEKTANLSMTQGVTISEDDTTAAIMDEIAQEKAQSSTMESTASQLFRELENTYKDGEVNLAQPAVEASQPTKDGNAKPEEDLDHEFAKEDEFLKTFTTSVEEVFLDQPTAIISDYVPPTEDVNEHSRPAIADNGIKREKPSDIKTVPLVPEALGQEIWSSPYVDSATTKTGKTSVIANLGKWIFLILAFSVLGVLLLSGLAVMGIVPEKFSPIHTVIYSLQKSPQENTSATTVDEDLAPEMVEDSVVEEETPVEPAQNNKSQSGTIVERVKNYTFSNGSTLESKVQAAHPNLIEPIEWFLYPTEEDGVFSVAVKVPQNKDGQMFSYRFNYNTANNTLTPTTSGAKNIIENY